jgi:membrane-associated phospholipid phosphatase
MLLIFLHYDQVSSAYIFIIYHVAIIVLILVLPHFKPARLINLFRNWCSVLIVPTNYAELYYLVHRINPIDLDSVLIEIDLLMFGVHPTVWLEPYSHPILTEYLQWIYAMFYFLPLVLGAILYVKKQMTEFHLLVLVIVLGFYLSYLGYFLVPAIGPRFTIDYLQNEAVRGVWITTAIRDVLNNLGNIQRDAFPSGHTAITLLTIYYAKKHSKRYYRILLVVGTSLVLSTVYLRYHYVIDVIAGFLLTGLVILLGPWLYNRLRCSRKLRFEAVTSINNNL